jgi:hypothetical protein
MKDMRDAANDMGSAAADKIDQAKDMGRDAFDKGVEGAREYASKGMEYSGELKESLTEFAQRQPWIALAGAFVIGYVAARALRRFS